jgi:hypothetical protein
MPTALCVPAWRPNAPRDQPTLGSTPIYLNILKWCVSFIDSCIDALFMKEPIHNIHISIKLLCVITSSFQTIPEVSRDAIYPSISEHPVSCHESSQR